MRAVFVLNESTFQLTCADGKLLVGDRQITSKDLDEAGAKIMTDDPTTVRAMLELASNDKRVCPPNDRITYIGGATI
jgi:hypothetical protein